MYANEERVFEEKAEKMLRGQRELPSGRDYRAFYERYRTDVNNAEFDENYNRIFSGACTPGSPAWWKKKFKK